LNPHTHSRRRITLTRPPNIPLAGLTQWTQGHLTKGLESVVAKSQIQKITVKFSSFKFRMFRNIVPPSSTLKHYSIFAGNVLVMYPYVPIGNVLVMYW
jgi:hypothetical protein